MKHPAKEITLKNLNQKLDEAKLLCEKKKWDKALVLVQNCFKQFPSNVEVHWLLGQIYTGMGNLLEAQNCFNTAILLEPKNHKSYYLLAQFLKAQKRVEEAKNAYLACVKYNPSHAKAYYELGVLYHQQGNRKDAIQAYRQAIKIDPDYDKAYHQLGILYHLQNRLSEAIEAYLKALEGEKNDVGLLSNLGAAYTKDCQFDKAIACYESALKIDPNYIPAITNLGGTYIEMNQTEKAQPYMRQSLALDKTLAANWRNLTLCAQYTSLQNSDYTHIEELLSNPTLSEEDRAHLYFALGKILDDCKQYEKAFESYQKGNQIQAKYMVFRDDAFRNHVQRVIKIFSQIEYQDFGFEELEKEPQPLIIVGTPRSGKSLLENLLIQYGGIQAVGEIGISEFSEQLPIEYRPKGSYPYWMKTLTKDQAYAIKNSYLSRLKRDAKEGGKYLIDTMPGNFLYLGLFTMLFPKAKIIHCRRLPFDACLAMYFKYFIDGHGYTYDLVKLGKYYQQYEHMISFWIKTLPNKIFEINYEDIIFNKEKSMKPLMRYLALDESFAFNYDAVSPKEIGRWQHYETQLKPLIQTLNAPVSSDQDHDEVQSALQDMMSTAYYQYDQEDYDGAYAQCQMILKEDPNWYAPYHLMGAVLHRQGDLNAALDYFEQGIHLAPNTLALHIDMAHTYKLLGKQMQSENHLKIAQMLQQKMIKTGGEHLQDIQRKILLNALNCPIDIIDEFEKKILLQGKVAQDFTTQSYMTRSWDEYFTDLSKGAFKDAVFAGNRIWRMRAWHFLFKNMAVVDIILKQAKTPIRILDIGCATGYFRRFLEGNLNVSDKKEIYYWGVDIRRDVLLNAIKAVDDVESGAQGNLVPSAFIWHDTDNGLPFHDNHFDFVINFEMIKYLPIEEGKRLLAEMYRVLNPKGQLFFSTTYTTQHPGFMESVPFTQLEALLSQNGFQMIGRRGSQSNFSKLQNRILPEHLPLVKDLLKVHPPEMVVAMITPLYPQYCEQIMLQCKIIE